MAEPTVAARITLAFAVLLLFTAGIRRVWAGTTGILEGRVVDQEAGNPVFGATVLIKGTQWGTVTERDGRFIIHNLPAGRYSVRVQLIGYKPLVVENVEIHADLRTQIFVELLPQGIQLGEVVIHEKRPLIQRDVTGTQHLVSGEELATLPVTTFQEALGYRAGTTIEGNVRGGRTSEVMYLVDGLSVQDFLGGGLSADLPSSSIVEMNIQTGGFDAEYGSALSGVVNLVTKGGGSTHQLMLRTDRDDLFGGTETNREGELEGMAGGPIFSDKVFYLAAANYRTSGTRWSLDFEHFFPLPVEENLNTFGKIDANLTPTLRLSAQALVSSRTWRDYEFSWRFNLAGLPPESRRSNRAAIVVSNALLANTFWTLRLSRYHLLNEIGPGSIPSFDTTNVYEYDFWLRYIVSGSRMLWSRTAQDMYTVKADLTSQIFARHVFKAGAEFNYYHVSTDIVKYEPRLTYFGKPQPSLPLLNYSTRYNYFPKSGAAFVQDKIAAEDGTTINVGLRYDFLDPMASRPAIEFVPVKPGQYEAKLSGFVPARFKQQLSPRLGFSMPVWEEGFLYLNYGYYFQYPLFSYLYNGLDVAALQRGATVILGNPDLAPERTKSWEIGFKQILTSDVVGSVTYFKKQTTDQVDTKTFIPMDSKAAGDYGFAGFVNSPTADAEGVEFALVKSGEGFVTGEASYTFMNSEGLSATVRQGLDLAQWGFKPVMTPFPMSWDQQHTLKLNVSLHLPLGINANIFWHYHTARPYTYYPSRDGYTPLDTTLLFIPNNARMRDFNSIDVKFSKTIRLPVGKNLALTLYVDSRNILDKKNVVWMDSSGRIGGELGDPSAYYIGRRTKIGLKIEAEF